MDLTSVAIELYEQAPADFTAARNSRSKEASARGDRELAADIQKLPKPSASAWAVNRIAADTLREEYRKLGAELRDAQSRADREALTGLLRKRKDLLASTMKSVADAVHENGVRVSSSALSEVEQTLQAALADEDGFAAAFSRRLVRPIRADGLEPVDVSAAVGGPELAARRKRAGSSDGSGTQSRSSASKRSAAKKSADAARVRALDAANKADAAVKDVEDRFAALEHERERFDRDAAALQAEFDELERRKASLDESESALKRERVRALETSQRAARALH